MQFVPILLKDPLMLSGYFSVIQKAILKLNFKFNAFNAFNAFFYEKIIKSPSTPSASPLNPQPSNP